MSAQLPHHDDPAADGCPFAATWNPRNTDTADPEADWSRLAGTAPTWNTEVNPVIPGARPGVPTLLVTRHPDVLSVLTQTTVFHTPESLNPRLPEVPGGFAGTAIGLHVGAANRDPAVFADASGYCPGRPEAASSLTFSKWSHFCSGSKLSLALLEIGLEGLMDSLPDLCLDGTPRPSDSLFNGFGRLSARWSPKSSPHAARLAGSRHRSGCHSGITLVTS